MRTNATCDGRRHFLPSLCLAAALAGGQAVAGEDWFWTADSEILLRDYNGAPELDRLYGFGFLLAGDYLERGGFLLGFNYFQRQYVSPTVSGSVDRIDETFWYASGRYNLYPDALPGRLTLRLDGYLGTDDIRARYFGTGPDGEDSYVTTRDDILVFHPSLAFLNFNETFYLDLGLAYSGYSATDGITEDITVLQWTPTTGFGFNEGWDWVQLRGYLIGLSGGGNRVPAGVDATRAIEAKWIHWFEDAWLGVDSVQLMALGGKRILAVDPDAFAVYSVPDLQSGSAGLSVTWKLDEGSRFYIQGAYERYDDRRNGRRYDSTYFYMALSRGW